MAKSSSNVKLTTTDAHERARDYLDADEMDRLLAAAKKSTQGIRDYALLLMMYHHGLRVSEATMMRRDALMGDNTRVWVERLKGSLSTEQPIDPAHPTLRSEIGVAVLGQPLDVLRPQTLDETRGAPRRS